MRDILCQAVRIEPSNAALAYAADLAARLEGHVTGVYVQASPLDLMPRFGSQTLLDTLLRHAREQLAMARACGEAFVEHARALGARHAQWQIVEGFAPEVLDRLGLRHDLAVLEREAAVAWCTPADIGRFVLASRLPCIVVPKGTKEARLDCIALAWNGSAQAIRSIHAALPLLRHAARVVLLNGDLRADAQGGWYPPFTIEDYLAAHEIAVQTQTVVASHRGDGKALLAAAAHAGADLLVMGAYGRNRLDEWAFGGATRSALYDASIPVFLRH